jgi:predicted nucleic-acid-binding Zn-ribbon protein
MKIPSKCPKCGAEMQEGFILEHRMAVRWIVGTAETSFLGDIKAKGREQRHIESYRCVGCGYLESYAQTKIS